MTLFAATRQPRTVGLLEHFGTGNLGDDATVKAALVNLRQRWPKASIIGLSVDPGDSEKRHGIRSYPIRRQVHSFEALWSAGTPAKPSAPALKATLKALLAHRPRLLGFLRQANAVVRTPLLIFLEAVFLIKSFFVASGLDLLVVCGGGQLLDAWGGPWSFPYTLFKWILLAKLSGARCVFLNVGAGPLDHPLSKWFIRQALRRADYVSFRDARSKALVEALGVPGRFPVVADNAYGLPVPPASVRERSSRRGSETTVGLAPMAYCHPGRYWDRNRKNYDRLILVFGRFGSELIRRGHTLSLFSSDIWFDSEAIADVRIAIEQELGVAARDRIKCEPVTSIDDLLARLSDVDYFVTCRFHGVVFSHLANVPVVAVAHHPKISTLMGEFELSRFCVDIAECDDAALMDMFVSLVRDRDRVARHMAREVEHRRAALVHQFDTLFPPRSETLATAGHDSRSSAPVPNTTSHDPASIEIGSIR